MRNKIFSIKSQKFMDFNILSNGIDFKHRKIDLKNFFSKKNWGACINSHSIALSTYDKNFYTAIHSADFLLPDGIGIILAAKFFNIKIYRRVTGYDFFIYLCRFLNKKRNPRIFFLGSTQKVLHKLIDNFSRDFKNIQTNYYAPPFKKKFSSFENKKIQKKINDFAPDILFVGITQPLQEKWIHNNIEFLKIKLAIGIGAVFDYYSGNKKRPSLFIRKLGLEWFVRFLYEPKRLFLRVFKSNFIFFREILYYYLKYNKFFKKIFYKH
jgi:N-acetylglucosaminyldiphosphoundecaprenol N-acetyl-beta-D-mannosaminyltransferase